MSVSSGYHTIHTSGEPKPDPLILSSGAWANGHVRAMVSPVGMSKIRHRQLSLALLKLSSGGTRLHKHSIPPSAAYPEDQEDGLTLGDRRSLPCSDPTDKSSYNQPAILGGRHSKYGVVEVAIEAEAEAPPLIRRRADDPNQVAQASSHPLLMIALPQPPAPAQTPASPALRDGTDADRDGDGDCDWELATAKLGLKTAPPHGCTPTLLQAGAGAGGLVDGKIRPGWTDDNNLPLHYDDSRESMTAMLSLQTHPPPRCSSTSPRERNTYVGEGGPAVVGGRLGIGDWGQKTALRHPAGEHDGDLGAWGEPSTGAILWNTYPSTMEVAPTGWKQGRETLGRWSWMRDDDGSSTTAEDIASGEHAHPITQPRTSPLSLLLTHRPDAVQYLHWLASPWPKLL
ncbi:hypothetical protein B0J13DRAFT_652408 [Dactylonectria estremocensis]|uniref:Uncharacterized protein n=1 Tax=Dactylonectria estremocensis TaxID=1079267 RepID=A0A9P9DF48_9HYPO|nr:hypothetical protein B0J13DRAFT_652408 [Dactylonectria estremocensis]